MMISSVLLYLFIVRDGTLHGYEGLSMFILLIVFLFYLLRFQRAAVLGEPTADDELMSIRKIILLLFAGAGFLWGGSELLVRGAVETAGSFGVSERIIGITVVSVGTSIPELAASIIAIVKKEKAISLGNLLGSNVFNILAVLGITSMITPITIQDQHLLTKDIYWMIGFALAVLPLVFIPKQMRLGWKEGCVLLLAYLAFVWFTLI